MDFDFVTAVTNPTVMALRLVDKLFSKEVLTNSTVHGTKDFTPLDHRIITAIKGKLTTLHLFSSFNIQFKQQFIFTNSEKKFLVPQIATKLVEVRQDEYENIK